MINTLILKLSNRKLSSAIKEKKLGNCMDFVHTSMFMFGNYTALKFISHTHLSTSIYTYPSQFSAIEFKRKRYGWTKEISNYISFFFNYCYLGVLSSLTFTLSVTSITLLKPKQRPSVLTWPKQNIVCPSLSKNNVCAYWTC